MYGYPLLRNEQRLIFTASRQRTLRARAAGFFALALGFSALGFACYALA